MAPGQIPLKNTKYVPKYEICSILQNLLQNAQKKGLNKSALKRYSPNWNSNNWGLVHINSTASTTSTVASKPTVTTPTKLRLYQHTCFNLPYLITLRQELWIHRANETLRKWPAIGSTITTIITIASSTTLCIYFQVRCWIAKKNSSPITRVARASKPIDTISARTSLWKEKFLQWSSLRILETAHIWERKFYTAWFIPYNWLCPRLPS